MKSKSVFKNTAAVILAALFLAMTGCSPDPFYIRVTSIEGVPETGEAGTPLILTGTVRPVFASNKDIIWFVMDAGTTEASISGNILNTNAGGTVIIRAIIVNGMTEEMYYTQYFIIVIGNGAPPITDKEYTIVILPLGNEADDTLTASPEKGAEGVTVTLTYTVANTKHYNQLDFGGVTADIAPVEEAGTGTRTYTINTADSSNGVITITAVFTHTDLIIDRISFSEHDEGHITKTYGDAPFINTITNAHHGSGAITYHSSNTTVAEADNSGRVTILKPGSTVISAEKAADTIYAHAQTTYTLTVNPKPVTITGLSASNKVYDGTTVATVTGTAVINGLVGGDMVTVIAGTASFADEAVGNNKTVSFSGWSLGGADADNYTLSGQPASVTANIVINILNGDIIIIPNTDVTVGMELTAVYSGSENVTYQWKKDGVNIGGNSNKYTPIEAGSYTITVSAAGYNSKTSMAVNVSNPPPEEYVIKIDIIGNLTGDTVTASPDKGIDGTAVRLIYTMANAAHYNQLDFGGVTAAIAPVESAESGTRTYTINAADSSNGVITITAVFTHTNLTIDHIAFSEHNGGHITKTYGDTPFTNAITNAHHGSGAITYHSSDTTIATVNSLGQVTIVKSGFAVISAEKAADAVYAHAQTIYTLTVNPKPVTITGLSASNKVYDGTTTATVTGTPVINGLIPGDTVTVVAGTASFASATAGNNKIVTFNGWSLTGADAIHYTLSGQPAPVTANITNPSFEIVIDWTVIDEWQLIEQTAQAAANEDKVFTVTGSYAAYHWYLDGELVGISSTYTFNQPADVYQLVVVVTNSSGERRSGRCRITVNK